ncbi:MAG: hypothetical protein QXG91_04905 [Candidatus Aenigmatarchaeota archaeon]
MNNKQNNHNNRRNEIKNCRDFLSKELAFLKTNLVLLEKYKDFNKYKSFNKYKNFFYFLIINLLISSYLSIRKIYDKRNNTYSLNYLLKEIDYLVGKENYKRLKQIKNKIDEHINSEDIKNILIIVNNIIAHMNIKKNKSALDLLSQGLNQHIENFKKILPDIEKILNEILKLVYVCNEIEYSHGKVNIKNDAITTIQIDKIIGVEDDFENILKNLEDLDSKIIEY